MHSPLEPDILAASQPLQAPGLGEQRVISPMAVARLAESSGQPRREVEAVALESGVAPLHYLRNLSRFSHEEQARLLRTSVVLVGGGPVLRRVAELLASSGFGRLRVRPEGSAPAEPEALERAVRNANSSCQLELIQSVRQGGAETTGALHRVDSSAVIGALNSVEEERRLQLACRERELSLILGAAEGTRGQATVIRPGDPGVERMYNPLHLHLSPERDATKPPDARAALMVAAWLAEQVTVLTLGKGEVLHGRLLYADLDTDQLMSFNLR